MGLSLLLFGGLPAALLAGVIVAAIHEGTLAYDFHNAFFPAARAVLHGQSPYAHTTMQTLRAGTAFVYPPVAAFVFTPLALASPLIAGLAATAICLAAALLTLAVLGVRDWRCFGCALLWAPVICTIHLGAISTLLALGVAIAWRYRSSAWICGIAVGLVIAMKLFLWPLLLWLFAARYPRAGAIAVASMIAFLVVPWAAIGFTGLEGYPHMLHVLSAIEAHESFTIPAAVTKLGGSGQAGQAIGVVATILCAAAVYVTGRAGRERAALTLALGAALLSSPIVWLHYFALLLVVVPIYVRGFNVVWLLPIALAAFPAEPGAASGIETLTAIAAVAAILAFTVFAGRVKPVSGDIYATALDKPRRQADRRRQPDRRGAMPLPRLLALGQAAAD
jgi:alpha-1,2-mannosyltransferase